MKRQIQYCTTSDGTGIAFAATRQGPPIVRTSLWMTRLKHDCTEPVRRHVILLIGAVIGLVLSIVQMVEVRD